MCLGIPGKVVSLKDKKAKVKQNNHYHWLDISLIEDKIKIGDYLIAYQEVAINKISSLEAKKILNLIKEA